jgi:hypothetical protein
VSARVARLFPTAGALGGSPHCLTADIDSGSVGESDARLTSPVSLALCRLYVTRSVSVGKSAEWRALARYQLFRRHRVDMRVDMRGQEATRSSWRRLRVDMRVDMRGQAATRSSWRRLRVDMRGQEAQPFNQLENIAVVLSILGIIFATKRREVHLGSLGNCLSMF